MLSYLAPVVVLLAGLRAALDKMKRRKLLDAQSGIESIRNLDWREFEMLVGEAFRREGYEVTEVGGGGADGGIDLKLRQNDLVTLVQCKQWKAWKVGVKPIRELYGVMMAEKAHRAIFVTSGEYTADARTFAVGKLLELIDGAVLQGLIRPVERRAEESVAQEPVQLPVCPRCGNSMIMRTARRGANAGGQFWGCSAYPKCTGIVNV